MKLQIGEWGRLGGPVFKLGSVSIVPKMISQHGNYIVRVSGSWATDDEKRTRDWDFHSFKEALNFVFNNANDWLEVSNKETDFP